MQPDTNEIEPETPTHADEAQPPQSRRRRGLLIGAALAVLLAAGAGASYVAGFNPASMMESKDEPDAAYIEIPTMTVNLRSPDGHARFLELRIVLVPRHSGDEERVRERLPLIIDAFQPFLRELRPEDLAGSAAVFRIKEELLLRSNAAAGAGTLRDILIQDLIER